MKIDWLALVIVAGVAVLATVVFVVLVSVGVRLLAVSSLARDGGRTAVVPQRVGQLCVGLAGLVVLYCIWLIVPQFH